MQRWDVLYMFYCIFLWINNLIVMEIVDYLLMLINNWLNMNRYYYEQNL